MWIYAVNPLKKLKTDLSFGYLKQGGNFEWKEPISLKNCTEKKNMALWKECLLKTAEKF